MIAMTSVRCSICGDSMMFNLSPRTMGGKSEICTKCLKITTVVFETDREETIQSIRSA